MDEAFEIEARALAQVLEELDYFQILKIGQNAHPGEMKDTIGRIYKRINEAYVCLRDDTKRAKYLADVLWPERQKKLRFVEASEQELKKEKEQEVGATPQGRKFFMAGLADMAAQRFASAERNFKMALTYEPSNLNFKAKRDEAGKLIKNDMSIR